MEMEYKDPSRRGRWIVLLGVVLAVLAGGAAFFLVNNAQQQAGQSGLKTIQGYVAAKPILARQAIVQEDIELRSDIPLDPTNAGQVVTDPAQLVGRLLAVDVPQGQLLTSNLLASGTVGLGFAILRPDETVQPESEAWRAVSVTVPDDRAVGGVIGPGMAVDIFVTATVSVPAVPPAPAVGAGATPAPTPAPNDYYTDHSTKIAYQDMKVLARTGTYYVVKVPLVVAEEISHMQADGVAQFSLALRPDQDLRVLDVSQLGATTNRIIERYGLPIPEAYPSLNRPIPTNPPIPAITPPPASTASPETPAPSASPSG